MQKFKLTLLQFAASRFLIINYTLKNDGLICAVCGAGKTEMCFPLFDTLITSNKIAFAIPRIDICNDIYHRLVEHYGNTYIGLHTGNKKINLTANIIVLTTNQLLKYKHYFQLIIIDEVDAFPFDFDSKFYNGVNECLESGSIFYLTSTPSERLLNKEIPTFTIYKRWHNYPLPIPKLIHINNNKMINLCIKSILIKRHRNLLIFIATINKGQLFLNLLQKYNINCQFVYSSHPKRQQLIKNWCEKDNSILLTTTILERGVTFDNIDVLVIDSDDNFYNKAALVQIAGRVGRKIQYQDGKVYFAYTVYTQTIKDSIKFIKSNNNKI